MKRIIISALYIVSAISLFSSCRKDIVADKDSELTFTACFSDTKASFAQGKMTWEEGDEIAICDGYSVSVAVLTSEDLSDSGHTATFSVKGLLKDAAEYYAVYPADCAYRTVSSKSEESFLSGGLIRINTGTGSVGKHSTFKCYAVADAPGSSFTFHNVGALVCFNTDRKDISKVSFKANSSTSILSVLGVNPANGSVSNLNIDTYSAIEYIMGEDKEAFIPVNAGVKMSGGYTLTAYDTNGKEIGSIVTDSDLTFENGRYYTIKNFDDRISHDFIAPIMGKSTSYTLRGTSELSSLCLSADKSHLWGVGDSGVLYKITFSGTSQSYHTFSGSPDMEGITLDPVTKDLLVSVERKQVVYRLPYSTDYKSYTTIITVEEASSYSNDGLEGITWYKDNQVYVGSQKNSNLWTYKTDGTKVSLTSLASLSSDITEIADLDYDPVTDILWVIDSEKFKLFALSGDASKVLAVYDLKGITQDNPESVCVDHANGCIWIADDNTTSKLIKIEFSGLN